MLKPVVAAALMMATASPALAEQSQAYFAQGLQTCLDFSPDGWMVLDRLEAQGWTIVDDPYYEARVAYTPGKSVWVVPPPEDGSVPAACSIISGTVGIIHADQVVRHTLMNAPLLYEEGQIGGCTALDLGAGRVLEIYSDGQDDFCTDPASARVVLYTTQNPLAGQ